MDVFAKNSHNLHVSNVNAKDCPLWVTLPTGLPTLGQDIRLGIFIAKPAYLPVVIQFDDWDLFHILEGHVAFEWAGGQRVEAGPGDFCLIPPHVHVRIVELKPTLRFFYCHFDFRHPHKPDTNDDAAALADGYHLPVCFGRNDAPEVAGALDVLLADHMRQDLPSHPLRWQLEAGLIRLLGQMVAMGKQRLEERQEERLRIVLYEHQAGMVGDSRLRKLLLKIEASPAYPWSVAELASEVQLSTGRLHTLCKQRLGVSLKRYLVTARLRKAITLLKETTPTGRLPIHEVARLAGFSSQHYFTRQFQQYYGLPPGKYRAADNGL